MLSALLLVSTFNATYIFKRFIGDATYYGPPYEPGAPYGVGACENDPENHDFYVALGAAVYQKNVHCGLCVMVEYNGKSTIGPVVDLCPTCSSGVDLSIAMMNELTGGREESERLGRIPVTWDFVACPSGRGIVGNRGKEIAGIPEVVTTVATQSKEAKCEATTYSVEASVSPSEANVTPTEGVKDFCYTIVGSGEAIKIGCDEAETSGVKKIRPWSI